MVELEVVSKTRQCIHYKVMHKASKFWCYVSFIYASDSSSERAELWQALQQLNLQGPWLLWVTICDSECG